MSKFSNAKIHFDPLTDRQKEVLTGCLLGDAQLCLEENSLHPYLKIERKLTDRKYLEWQYGLFENFCKSEISDGSAFDDRTGKTYYRCRFCTRNIPEFLSLYHKWYQDKIKIVPRDMDLSPLSVAVWFADDGCIKHIGKSELKTVFATNGFSHDDVLFLADLLKCILHENFRVVYSGLSKKGKPQFTLEASSAGTYALIKYMEPEFSKLSMDRKNVWSSINLNIAAKDKRSVHYYQLADCILSSTSSFTVRSLSSNIYPTNYISEVLLRFYKLGYFTRLRSGEKGSYHYTLTDTGKQYFLALQFEKQFINKE